jgi:capsular exopolysaccharide synthesis family protein
MSRIFEALQRSESERAGLSFVETELVAPEFLQATENREVQDEFQSLVPSPGPDSRLVCISDPTSLAAEKFRTLAVRLRQLRQSSQQSSQLKRVLVTSAVPEEGKSVCAANLATSLARNREQRTLLIEGDLRRPTIRQNLGLSPVAGLTDWLRGDVVLDEILYRIDPPGCWFLPAGRPMENVMELMQAEKMSELFDRISPMFDWIVIDSTPVVPLADAVVWARYSDGVLLVAREGKTEKRPFSKAVDVLTRYNLLGLILNGSSNANYNHYYQSYFSRSGQNHRNQGGEVEASS